MSRLALIFLILLSSSCSSIEYFGNEKKGFVDAPQTKFPIEKALVKARPYLVKTFELRSEKLKRSLTKEPLVWVSLKGGWFYFVLDNYPSYSPGFYLTHAVKINSETGELIEPK